jgi:hypothetical protein
VSSAAAPAGNATGSPPLDLSDVTNMTAETANAEKASQRAGAGMSSRNLDTGTPSSRDTASAMTRREIGSSFPENWSAETARS